ILILEHYFASRSYARVKDELCRNFPDVVVLKNSTITIIIAHLRECGSVEDKKRTGRQAILTAAKLAQVRNVMECSPSKILWRLSAGSGISYGSSQRAMKWLHYHAYHVQTVQEFKEPDEKRVAYCTWLRPLVSNQ
ncbi:hypothetical protein C0J52_11710, partial [Blattella germanica]